VAGSLAETPPPAPAAADTPTSKRYLVYPAANPIGGLAHHQAITPTVLPVQVQPKAKSREPGDTGRLLHAGPHDGVRSCGT
jgi:hypothetical protein